MRYGVCCIVLNLENNDQPKKFKKMTYKGFASKPRQESINLLSERILNNIDVTYHAIKYCQERNYCYRLSSDLFPLITYDKAELNLTDLPHYDQISNLFSKIKNYIIEHKTRISCHPSEFNVLASTNQDAVNKTIRELNFYSWFMDQIGCPADYNSPMNLHIHNNQGEPEEIINRFISNCERLDPNCMNRLVIENDDKINCWSVSKLYNYYHKATGKPITFDFLHHKCHPDNLTEKEAFEICYETWKGVKPLFHYSESREGKNPRAHADYATGHVNTYGRDIDVDFELKMKDLAITEHSKNKILPPTISYEEMKKRASERGGRTTEQILEAMRAIK
jgi:UV DNA damage endonuclease